MKKVYIKTFGCQMNVHDSERMLGILKSKGYTRADRPGSADLIVFNTCSIREKAEQKFYSDLGKVKKIKSGNPDLKIAVMGCIAQQEGRKIRARAPYVDHIIGPQNIGRVGEALEGKGLVFVGDNPGLSTDELPVDRDSTVRAWVNIMYGCNNYCSYCVVPYTRGREVSRPSESILSEIDDLAKRGYREVTLLGQNVNSYKGDMSFPQLLKEIDRIEGISRIRFVTSHPKDLGSDLVISLSELDKVCEHIHLPLQSGSTEVLRRMNRKYTMEDYSAKIDMLRKAIPDISITTDVITGFPGETDEDHNKTIRALEDIRFDGIFAFKYSQRPMTKAAEMDGQLDERIRSGRLAEVLELQDRITLEKNSLLEGTEMEVLVEDVLDRGMPSGRTRSNKIVRFRDGDVEKGSIVMAYIEQAHKHNLIGRRSR